MSNTSTPMAEEGYQSVQGPRNSEPSTRGSAERNRVVSVGELLWDVFDEDRRLGGSAANVAYHAARRGAEAHLVSRVGRDTLGRRARDALAAAGVDVRHVQQDDQAPTGTVMVTLVAGQPRFEIGENAAWDHISWSTTVQELCARADVLCLSVLSGRTEKASRERNRALERLQARTPRPWILVDLNLRPPHTPLDAAWELLKWADIVKVNEEELAALEQERGTERGARLLLEEASLTAVCVTRGAAGAELHGPGRPVKCPVSPEVWSRVAQASGDPVGAGDAFVAAFSEQLSARSREDFWQHAEARLQRAVDYAAEVAHLPGAMPGLNAPS